MTPLDVLTAALVGLGACIGGALPGLYVTRRRRGQLAQARLEEHRNVAAWAARERRILERVAPDAPNAYRDGGLLVLDHLEQILATRHE